MFNRKIPLSFSSVVVTAAMTLFAASASAQEATPPANEPAPAVHHTRSAASTGNAAGLGVGAAAFIGGPAGPEATYDFGAWHLSGLVGFDRRDVGGGPNPSRTILDLGVSAWYHLHMGASSDFSLGGGIGYSYNSQGAGASAIVLEPGAMVRAFVTPNVAVFGRLAVVLAFDNAGSITEHLGLAGNLMGVFGFTYFFGG